MNLASLEDISQEVIEELQERKPCKGVQLSVFLGI